MWTTLQKVSFLEWMIALAMLALTIGLGYQVNQSDFSLIAPFYVIFFGLYAYTFTSNKQNESLTFFLGWAILLRLILVFTLPNLSDDIYRFIWDGRLIINGLNPFDHLPSYYIENEINIPGINQALFNQLNSPEYFTIYPPIAQATFAISCWLFPSSVLGASIVMKSFLLGFEIGSIFLIVKILRHLNLPAKHALLYALNPLIIIEIVGNLHFEGGMIFFLLLAFYFLLKAKNDVSALAMAASIASKLLPLIFLPFLIRRLGWWKSIRYFIIVGITLILLFVPIFSNTFIDNFGSSLDLYFRKFEFNASVYYIARWVGYQYIGYNLIASIGPKLALGTLVGVGLMTLFERKPDWNNFPIRMLFAICLYLLFTTTVHPWYASLPLVLCLFTRFRFPVLWSFLITLTYINYSYPEYQENLWIVGFEYTAVILFLTYEYFFTSKASYNS